MPTTRPDPWELASLDQLLAIARAMEQEAIAGYAALSRRMSAMGRPDLGMVFDSLVLEETGHLGKVDEWRAASGRGGIAVSADAPHDLFQDEGAGTVAPELMSAYRAFSTAVRNEERAFAFWTYVSAHAKSDAVKDAAERMAREELGHVSTLRRERRKAFHAEKDERGGVEVDLGIVEREFRQKLEGMGEGGANAVAQFLREADERAEQIVTRDFKAGPPYRIGSIERLGALALAEYLLDWYIKIGDEARTEIDAASARLFAGQMVNCIRVARGVARSGSG